ncbi:MAG: hypothetical protein KDC33_08370 [Thermoleophilia bacterium]|nr:hypothetical protein [Thermoleophilia bacterium]
MGLMDKARDAAKKGADMAQRGVEEAKTTGEKAMVKRKATAVAAELGDAVYRQRNGEAGLEPEVDRLVDELRSLRAELERLHAEDAPA